jgi:hypothetical protein
MLPGMMHCGGGDGLQCEPGGRNDSQAFWYRELAETYLQYWLAFDFDRS